MAYKNNLLEYYGGGSVGNSLLGMRTGGLASIARARKMRKSYEDVERRAKEIRKKQGRSGMWGTIGKIAGTALGAALAPATGGLSLLAAKSIGSGLGSYAGAKLGYG